MENVTIGLALIAGLLSFISPCVLPLVPAYVGYMGSRVTRNVALQVAAGPIKNDMAVGGMRIGMLLHGLVFVLGFTVVFVTIGLITTGVISALSGSLGMITDIIGRVGGVIIVLFGLHFMGVLPALFNRLRSNPAILANPLATLVVGALGSVVILWGFVELVVALPVLAVFWLGLVLGGAFSQPANYWNRIIDSIQNLLYSDTRQEMDSNNRQGLGGSFVMGVVFSAGWTPCIGPLLGTILTLAATTGDVGQAVPLLTAYSLGLGIPFVLTALLVDSAQGVLRRLQRQMRTIELVSGGLLVLIGLLVASGRLQDLSSSLNAQFADFSYRVEECGVGFFEGDVYLSHLGPCMSGSLVPVALNQGALPATLDADLPKMEYIFHGAADQKIYLEFGELSSVENVPLLAILYSPADKELTRAEGGTRVNDETVLALDGFTLPEEGIYRIEVTSSTGLAHFRLKVRETAPEIQVESGEHANAPLIEVVELGQLGAAVPDEESALGQLAGSGLNNIESLAEASGPAVGVDVGNLAPDFTIFTDGGEEVSLSDFRGQVILLNFWGTWCGPCRREMPEFQRTFEEYSENGFNIFAVAVRDTPEKVVEFREEFGLTFTLALDAEDTVSALYSIQTQPSTLVIDANGVIIARHFGMLVESQIKELVEEALS